VCRYDAVARLVSSHARHVRRQTDRAADLRQAADQLAARLPTLLAPLARVAFNYAWSWMPDGNEVFEAIDAHRWQLCQRNPVRLLLETPTASQVFECPCETNGKFADRSRSAKAGQLDMARCHGVPAMSQKTKELGRQHVMAVPYCPDE
jgi:hypothetical protein